MLGAGMLSTRRPGSPPVPGAAPALALAELLPEGRAWEGCQQQLLTLAPKLEAGKESMESGAVIWSGKRGTGVVGREALAGCS